MATRNSTDYLNLYRSEAQNHYRTQQSISKKKIEREAPSHQLKDFLAINFFGWVYHYIKSRFGKKHPFLDYSKATSNGIFEMFSEMPGNGNKIRIATTADWASDTPESDKIAQLITEEEPHYTIHLGDTYFVGAPMEIEDSFLRDGSAWPKGKSGSLALPGNHEFYSNGNAYFDKLLPSMFVTTGQGTFSQDASFFCLENDYWRVIGLDTGYHSVGVVILELILRPDAHLDEILVKWLKEQVKPGDDNRGIILLSHHQYCSAFEGQFTKAAETLKKLIGGEREVIWLWGHEHRFAVYGQYQSKDGIKAYGRCIGHGGMPAEVGKVDSNGKESFNKPDTEAAKKYNLVFYDGRKKGIIGKTIVGHNGYAVIDLDNEKMTITYKDDTYPGDLFKEEWTVDIRSGKISGKAFSNADTGLGPFSLQSFDNAVSPLV